MKKANCSACPRIPEGLLGCPASRAACRAARLRRWLLAHRAALRASLAAFVRAHIVDWDPDPEATIPPREDHASGRYFPQIIPDAKRERLRAEWNKATI